MQKPGVARHVEEDPEQTVGRSTRLLRVRANVARTRLLRVRANVARTRLLRVRANVARTWLLRVRVGTDRARVVIIARHLAYPPAAADAVRAGQRQTLACVQQG